MSFNPTCGTPRCEELEVVVIAFWLINAPLTYIERRWIVLGNLLFGQFFHDCLDLSYPSNSEQLQFSREGLHH